MSWVTSEVGVVVLFAAVVVALALVALEVVVLVVLVAALDVGGNVDEEI